MLLLPLLLFPPLPQLCCGRGRWRGRSTATVHCLRYFYDCAISIVLLLTAAVAGVALYSSTAAMLCVSSNRTRRILCCWLCCCVCMARMRWTSWAWFFI